MKDKTFILAIVIVLLQIVLAVMSMIMLSRIDNEKEPEIPDYVTQELNEILTLHEGENCFFKIDKVDEFYIATLYYQGTDPHVYTKSYIIKEGSHFTVWGEE